MRNLFGQGEITLQAMDSSHVSLVSLRIVGAGPNSINLINSTSMELGLNINQVAKMLRCADDDDCLTIEAKEQDDTVRFRFTNAAKTKTSEFELKKLAVQGERLGIPETRETYSVKMPGVVFREICSNLAVVGETLEITVNRETISFSCKGSFSQAQITCRNNHDKVSIGGLMDEDELTLAFALRYVCTFTKAAALSEYVKIDFTEEMPLLIGYHSRYTHLEFFLAPRIEDDESDGSF